MANKSKPTKEKKKDKQEKKKEKISDYRQQYESRQRDQMGE
jgi:hypothetical protein